MRIGVSLALTRAGNLRSLERLIASGKIISAELPGTPYGISYQERTGASATTVAGDGDPVGTWHDLISDTYRTAPTDDTTRPLLKTDGSAWWHEYDGTNDRLGPLAFSSPIPQPVTIGFAHRLLALPASNITWWDSYELANRMYMLSTASGAAVFVYAGATSRDVGVAADTVDRTWRLDINGASSRVFRDGAELTLSGALGSNSYGGVTMGGTYAGALHANQRVYAHIVCAGPLTDSETADLDAILAARLVGA